MKRIVSTFILFLFALSLHAQTNPKADPSKIAYGDNKAAGNYAKIRGMNMYYETYGEGKPLLIIHGNSGSIGDFSKQIPYFAKKYKVIVADSRDHGKTLDTLNMVDSLSYEQMSDDYAALLSHLKIDSAFVLGWSDGGINGLLLAMRHPEKVKKLAITGANLWPDTNSVEPFVLKYFDGIKKYYDKQKPSIARTVLLRHFNLLLTQPQIKPASLAKIQCPTLVMAGDQDVIKVAHTLLIAKSIPNSNLWISPNSGHGFLVLRSVDKFNVEVDEFFQRKYKKIAGRDLFQN
ncbi:alpha/beta hydrolase [Pedobacter sp. KR3-3]|uniref:Alpha/beta hydrolase n=1 Tax=Pedobacter albus TaxID=3113905 RepID=A0ABU7I2B4_9SPHI|nr:alpha/beta hydrolase [Pedobacter sp. KR3-3]MEE1943506.1 alpha/beta hydrolase [Pedobacter sp. KR3-3]